MGQWEGRGGDKRDEAGMGQWEGAARAYVISVSIMPSRNLQKISTRSLEGDGK